MAARWSDYVLATSVSDSVELWNAAAEMAESVLLICGAGFDPRTMDVPRAVHSQSWDHLKVLALRSGIEGAHQSAEDSATAHEDELRTLFADVHFIEPENVQDPASTGTKLSRQLVSVHDVLNIDMVIVDMSGLPSSISFPLIQLFLKQSVPGVESNRFDGDLFVAVSEDASTDARILPTGLDKPGNLNGFPRLEDNGQTRVWVPVLGEGAAEELAALRRDIQADEVCPVLPFPSSNPRRADELLVEHHQLLLEDIKIDPRNILYAAETNPFDLYRQLVNLAERYRRALEPLGGATIVASEHTSKLLALGVLLAAHEKDIVVEHVRPTGYQLMEAAGYAPEPTLFTTWLTGHPYVGSSWDDERR